MTYARRARVALLLAMCGGIVNAQTGGPWQPVGPAPTFGGQVEGIVNREVAGAVEALAQHPSNADILYIGSVNGGIWRSTNATAASPTWTRLTDTLGTLSISALEFDPTDATRQTLLAGTGRTSSYGGEGGELIGLLRTTNGGTTWTNLNSGGVAGSTISGVAARGAILVAASGGGIYRSTDSGTTFTLISGLAGSGLPVGRASDLVGDPTNNARLYAPILSGGARGIYRSTDTGATWTKVSDTAVDAVLTAGANGSVRTELAVGASGQVYAAIVATGGRLAEVFRSADGATGWTALGVPTTTEQDGVLFGLHPGGQGSLHLSIAADPTDSNIVYVGGDRQPFFGEGVEGSNQFFPNSIGANDFSGRLFRGNAAAPAGSRWTTLTHSGAANNSSPHADSRELVFDAQGNLLEASDGGVYKRTSPRLASGAWLSLNGNMQVTEFHGAAWDAVNNRVIGGSQDNGTSEQRTLAGGIFDSVSGGDGGDPAVEDRVSATASVRYSSFQFLQGFRRRTFNASNVVTGDTFPPLTPTGGAPEIEGQFYTPIAVNEAGATGANRVVIGGANGLYESLDGGSTAARISTLVVNAFRGDPLVYGLPGNPAYLLFASNVNIQRRATAGSAIELVGSLASSVFDIAVDPDSPNRIFAMTGTSVHLTTNGAAPFTNITGTLIATQNPSLLRSMAFIPGTPDRLVVSANRGVFVSTETGNFTDWQRLGTGLPNVPVFELEYDAQDAILVAATLGRGAWTLTQFTNPDTLFANGFEATP
jgi:hypothetical protein